MTTNGSRKLGFVLAALLLLVIGTFLVERSANDVAPDPEPTSAGTTPVAEGAAPAAAAQPEKTIAVLPFANTSVDPQQDYLAQGIARELLGLLDSVPGLRVASRSAAFRFQGDELDLAEVAQALGVEHVLRGSVDRSGEQLVITARLLRTADGSQVWSQSYERSLDEIFATQDDIAAAVVAALGIDSALLVQKSEVVDPEAYLLWLQGRYFYGQWGEENFERAVDANRAALKIDPDYVEAWASLAVTYLTQTQSGYREIAFGTALAKDAIQKALEIDPNRASVLARLAHIQMMIEWDWDGAQQTITRALEVAPRDTRVLGAAAYLANCFGDSDNALAYLERALAEDPNNLVMLYNTAEVLHRAGRLRDASNAYRQLLELNPDDLGTHTQLAVILLQQDDPEAAWRELELEREPQQQEYGRLLAMPAVGRGDEVEQRLKLFIEKNQTWAAYLIASIYAWHGDRDNAFLWLDHAYRQHAAAMPQVLLEPTLAGLRDDPRWDELVARIGLPTQEI